MSRRAIGWSRNSVVVALCIVTLSASPGSVAQDAEEPPLTSSLQTRVAKVAVFKNGYGLWCREGRARPVDGWMHADYLPYASLGTIWVYTLGQQDLVDRVVSARRIELAFDDDDGLERLLRERVESRVAMTTVDGRQFDGKLTALVEGMALLEGQDGLMAVKLDTVKDARLVDRPLRVRLTTDEPVDVGMTYLQPGIRWLPTYSVSLGDDGTADMRLRATLVTEAEDLEDTTVHFVVGVPSFAFEGDIDPLVLNRVGGAIQPSFTTAFSNQAAVTEMARARMDIADQPEPDAPPAVRGLPDLPGEDVGELFMYEVDDVDLKIGEVAMLTVFQTAAPYRDVYLWDADGLDVWRCAKLTNDTGMPWTTAPAAIYSDWRMVGQNTLTYTPASGEKDLKVAISRDIGAKATEREVERKVEQTAREGVKWTIVTLEASLEMRNYLEEPAEITVTRSVKGEVLQASDDAEVSRPQGTLDLLNPANALSWTVTLEPGEMEKLTYRYRTWVK